MPGCARAAMKNLNIYFANKKIELLVSNKSHKKNLNNTKTKSVIKIKNNYKKTHLVKFLNNE